jgi:hypothetical protein
VGERELEVLIGLDLSSMPRLWIYVYCKRLHVYAATNTASIGFYCVELDALRKMLFAIFCPALIRLSGS